MAKILEIQGDKEKPTEEIYINGELVEIPDDDEEAEDDDADD